MKKQTQSLDLYDIELKTIEGKTTTLAAYRGKTLLIVNVASRCGFTPQYAGLEKLYEKYKDEGFAILGFPSNQFGGQEPGTDPPSRAWRHGQGHPRVAARDRSALARVETRLISRAGCLDRGCDEPRWQLR